MAKGSPEQNKAYCSKADSRAAGHTSHELGKMSKQGQRTDLVEYTTAVLSGVSKRSLAEAFPTQFLKYPRGTEALRAATAKSRDASYSNTVVVYSGGTGTGKTWRAHNELKARFGANGYYVCEGRRSALGRHQRPLLRRGLVPHSLADATDSPTRQAKPSGGTATITTKACLSTTTTAHGRSPICSGFVQQSAASRGLFEAPYQPHFVQILHEHPQICEVKGGMVNLRAKYFIITSNINPEMWYPNADLPHQAALKRRITRYEWMDQPYVPIKNEPGMVEESPEVINLDSDDE